jgi:hypothetical protein
MQLPKLIALLAAITFTTANATNTQLISTGPILLRYTGSVLPTGVCKLMECSFQSSSARGIIKDYSYEGIYGNLTVTRDAKMRITAAQYSANVLTSSGIRAEVIKFARGFAGVNLTDRNVSDCLNGQNLTGQAANGVNFEFSCTQIKGKKVIGVVDRSVKQSMAISPPVPTQNTAVSPPAQLAVNPAQVGFVGWPGDVSNSTFCRTFGCVLKKTMDAVGGQVKTYSLEKNPRTKLLVTIGSDDGSILDASLIFNDIYYTSLNVADKNTVNALFKNATGRSVSFSTIECKPSENPNVARPPIFTDDGKGHNYQLSCSSLLKRKPNAQDIEFGIIPMTLTSFGVEPKY